MHPDQIQNLRLRTAVIKALRARLDAEGFLEVETPILHTVHGGASARPFRTYINAYGEDLTLRIAPELYLKRLVVGVAVRCMSWVVISVMRVLMRPIIRSLRCLRRIVRMRIMCRCGS